LGGQLDNNRPNDDDGKQRRMELLLVMAERRPKAYRHAMKFQSVSPNAVAYRRLNADAGVSSAAFVPASDSHQTDGVLCMKMRGKQSSIREP
jgi:hypothetical protein